MREEEGEKVNDTHFRFVDGKAFLNAAHGVVGLWGTGFAVGTRRGTEIVRVTIRFRLGFLLLDLDLGISTDLDPVVATHVEYPGAGNGQSSGAAPSGQSSHGRKPLSERAVHLGLAEASSGYYDVSFLEAQLSRDLVSVLEEDELDGQGKEQYENDDVVRTDRQPVHEVTTEVRVRLGFIAIRQQDTRVHR